MSQSHSRYSKRSKTPGILGGREPSKFVGGTGSTNINTLNISGGTNSNNLTRTESMQIRQGEGEVALENSQEEFDPINVESERGVLRK